MNQQDLSSLIMAMANLLRGDYKQSEYGKVILPFTVLRRLGLSSTRSLERRDDPVSVMRTSLAKI